MSKKINKQLLLRSDAVVTTTMWGDSVCTALCGRSTVRKIKSKPWYDTRKATQHDIGWFLLVDYLFLLFFFVASSPPGDALDETMWPPSSRTSRAALLMSLKRSPPRRMPPNHRETTTTTFFTSKICKRDRMCCNSVLEMWLKMSDTSQGYSSHWLPTELSKISVANGHLNIYLLRLQQIRLFD